MNVDTTSMQIPLAVSRSIKFSLAVSANFVPPKIYKIRKKNPQVTKTRRE